MLSKNVFASYAKNDLCLSICLSFRKAGAKIRHIISFLQIFLRFSSMFFSSHMTTDDCDDSIFAFSSGKVSIVGFVSAKTSPFRGQIDAAPTAPEIERRPTASEGRTSFFQ